MTVREGKGTPVVLLVWLAALVWLAGTATFLFDADDTRFVRGGAHDFGIEHSCLTAYATADHLARGGTPNLYDPRFYRDSEEPTPIHEAVEGVFGVDSFHYPPFFLVSMRPLVVLTGGDFFALRALWYALTVAALCAALYASASWCGALRRASSMSGTADGDGPAAYGLRFLPVLFLAPTVHIALQIGNAHLLVLALAVWGMVLLERQRLVLGAAFVGLAVVTKIWPGILVLHLLLRRRWGAAGACLAAAGAYALLTLVFFGPEPIRAFLEYELPRIRSGESFAFMQTNERALTGNVSVFGIAHKLHALGLLSEQPQLLSRLVDGLMSSLVLLVALWGGLRRTAGLASPRARLGELVFWLSLMALVQLRSPFLPWSYGVVCSLWLLAVLGATARGWRLLAIALAWIMLALDVPFDAETNASRLDLIYTLCATAVMLVTAAEGLRVHSILRPRAGVQST